MKKLVRKLALIYIKFAQTRDEPIEKIAQTFVLYLHEEKKLWLWREIIKEVHSVWKKEYGYSDIYIKTAQTISLETKRILEKKFQGADMKIDVLPELMAGAIIQVDDVYLDGSIAGQLSRLEKFLIS